MGCCEVGSRGLAAVLNTSISSESPWYEIIDMKKPLLTLQQVAELLAISTKHVIRLTKAGQLPFIDLGVATSKIRRFDPDDVDAFLERRKVTLQPPAPARRPKQHTPLSVYKVFDFAAVRQELKDAKRKKSDVKPVPPPLGEGQTTQKCRRLRHLKMFHVGTYLGRGGGHCAGIAQSARHGT